MARVKGGVHTKKKHKSVMARAKGFRGARSRRFKVAKEAVMHAERYAYRDRRARKGDFRRLWITRINAAARMDGLSYSRFMHGLKLADVEVDRKNLADLAVREPEGFSALVAVAKQALDGGPSGNGSSAAASPANTEEPVDEDVEPVADTAQEAADTDEADSEESVDEVADDVESDAEAAADVDDVNEGEEE